MKNWQFTKVAKNFGIRPQLETMPHFTRITIDPQVMGGKSCIRGMRVTVDTILNLLAAGHARERILKSYPYLESADINEAIAYGASRESDREATDVSSPQ
jgi:uncharacterized protein (DUF433 family)